MRQHESKHIILHEVQISDTVRKEGKIQTGIQVQLRPSKTGVVKLGDEHLLPGKKKKKNQLSDLCQFQFSNFFQYFYASDPRSTQNHHPL